LSRRQAGHDDDGRRAQAHDLFKELEPVHAGHLDIERNDIGVQFAHEDARILSGRGLPDHSDIGLAFEKNPQQRPHRRAVIYNEYLDRHYLVL